jgi:Domain of unknown function (DUF6265)
MKHIFWTCLLVLLGAKWSFTVDVQQPKIDLVRWLAGNWKGEAFGGIADEIWTSPAGGTMMGMFRLVENGKVSFFEFEQLVEQDNRLVFRVKHFTSGFVGWEEKDKSIDFKFLSATKNEIHFDGLTLIEVDDRTCKHVIRLQDKATGQSKDVEIIYHRVD